MTEIWLMIALVALGSYVSRGFFFLQRARSPEASGASPVWLDMVPSAAFAALVMPALLAPDGDFRLVTPELLAALAAAIVAWRTKSIAATILLGLGAYILLGQLGWPA